MDHFQLQISQLSVKEAHLAVQVGLRIVVGDDEFAEFGTFFLRQRIIPAKRQNVIVLVELSDEGTVVVGEYDIALALRKHLPQADVEMSEAADVAGCPVLT